MSNTDIQTIQFDDDGHIPNNPDLPLILYRRALNVTDQTTDDCRRLFESNGWGGSWVNGVYDYHHYHSTAHEVLGVTAGSARVQFGGEQGEIIAVETGDVVVIPAGVGHCRVSASPDFRVVGAYPAGQDWDIRRGSPEDRPEVLKNIQAVPLPEQDPVGGESGFLLNAWQTT